MRTFVLLCVCVAAASAKLVIPDSYLIALKDGCSLDDFVNRFENLAGINNVQVKVKNKYRKVVNGIAAKIPEQYIDLCIDYIEEDQLASKQAVTWGIDRVDQRSLPLDGAYTPTGTGFGANLYVLDTGIRATHNEFGGRATAWFDSFGGDGFDCDGHGTHCAGTAAGLTYGVATEVNVFALRVLNCDGTGSLSGIVSALDEIVAYGSKPGVLSMSLGASGSMYLDNAVLSAIQDGFTAVVAAGNEAQDACNVSPARVPEAITVGATNNYDRLWPSSNFGNCVDILAPGQSITSALPTSDNAIGTKSGTSMAAPHVSGAAALLLAGNDDMTPAEVKSAILANGTPNTISNPGAGSPNLLLYVP